jgi:predicted  nucleic acid-binding Zn-ribbon protein
MNISGGSTLLLAAVLLAGCKTFYQNPQYASSNRQEAVRVEMARQQEARDLDVMKAKTESVDDHLQQLDTRMDRLEGALREAGTPQTDIAGLRRDIEQLRAERETLKKEVVDELSREIAKLLAAQPAPASRGSSASRASQGQQSGYEHKVQAGQTLSEIASAYKVPVDKIKKANNMSSDTIRVGQVLFVPD